jgi:murein L,D-transpeptidase YcbB/YkuD
MWSISGNIGPEAEALIGYLSNADLDGLKPKNYNVDKLRKTVIAARSGDAKAIAKAELELSKALSRYAADMRRLPKRDVTGVVYADPALRPLKKPSEEAVLRVGAMAPSFSYFVASMSWMSPLYLRMRQLLAQAQMRAAPEDVQRRLRLNLERTRFLPNPFARHIVVDAAAARLYYYQAGQQLGTMKVVVGKQASPTPMLVGMMHYAIVNPYWNVPVDLAKTLTAPKILAGRTLQSMNMEAMSDWSETAHVIDPATIDWQAVAAGTQEIRLRQLPGPFNSMGKVKFLFPNDMGIYLHDTPERELLDKENRHFSNGCIRLEDATGLGKWLLGKPLTALSRRTEQIVQLPVPVPVYLTYLTASGGPGELTLLDDVYGRDR